MNSRKKAYITAAVMILIVIALMVTDKLVFSV